MSSVLCSPRYGLVIACLLVVSCSLPLSACGVVGTATYKPPFVPVEFVIDTNGNISVQASASLATPIGSFGVGASAENNVPVPNDGLVMFIEHLVDGQPTDAGYQVNEDSPDKTLVIDGNVTVEFTGKLKSVNAIGRHTILLTTPENQNMQLTPESADQQPSQPAPTDTAVPPAPTDTPAPATLNVYADNDCALPPSQDPPYHWPSIALSNVSNQVVHWRAETDGAPAITLDPSQGTIGLGQEIVVQVNGSTGPANGHSEVLIVHLFDTSTGDPIILNGSQTPQAFEMSACGFG